MTDTQIIVENENLIRLSCFFGILIIMAVWEILAPRKKLSVNKSKRWLHNLSIVVLNTMILRLIFPTAAVGIALYAQNNDLGLFNHLNLAPSLIFVTSFILLDLIIYWQHVIFHRVPILWRVHRMHHADMDIDVTTGSRFHPIEIILSMLIKFMAILSFGIPMMAVIVFEVVLNATAMFNHSNVRLPLGLDRIMRLLIVTPDMHRVHHSVITKETHSNFGFNLSLWDRLFKTYRAQPERGHIDMQIGLPDFQDEIESERLPGMLMIPFKKV